MKNEKYTEQQNESHVRPKSLFQGPIVAISTAFQGLEINKEDAWSTHSMAHVLEMMGRQKEGISFMSSTLKDWSVRFLNKS